MDHLAAVGLLAFASYRATQLVVWDTIGDGLRLRLKVWRARREASRVRAFLDNLISCTYCAGWWLSMAAYVAYVTAAGQWDDRPLIVHAVSAWAVAGAQALLSRWDDTRPSGHDHSEES